MPSMTNSFELEIMRKGKTDTGDNIIDRVFVSEGNVPYIGELVIVHKPGSSEILYRGRVTDVRHSISNYYGSGNKNTVVVTMELDHDD